MSILMWEKPKKVVSKEEWSERQADGAPPGTYTPNMSEEDMMRWKAKLVGAKTGFPQVELRRNGMLIIVSRTGYKYKHYNFRQTPEYFVEQEKNYKKYGWQKVDPVVHIASAGPQFMSAGDITDMQTAIQEAFDVLDGL